MFYVELFCESDRNLKKYWLNNTRIRSNISWGWCCRHVVHTTTATIINKDSKHSLFSMLVTERACMFNEATKIKQLSPDLTCNFCLFLFKELFSKIWVAKLLVKLICIHGFYYFQCMGLFRLSFKSSCLFVVNQNSCWSDTSQCRWSSPRGTVSSLPQGSQMTRQARRLYVGNIPFGITEVCSA